MRKFFSCAIYCVFVLIALLFCDSWTFFTVLSVLIFVLWIIYSFLTETLKRNTVKKPGTVSHSKCYITKNKVTKPIDSCHSLKLDRSKGNTFNFNTTKSFFKAPVGKPERSVPFKPYSPFTKSCQTNMSFLRSSPSSSIGLFDSSPVRRRPLHSRNSIENNEENTCVSPTVRTPVREVTSRDGGDVTPQGALITTDSGSPNDNMSVGEFPLISLVSSIHEAVSPKTPRLKPSPIAIRIQPIQSPDAVSENRVDPVVFVLKQLASKKRVLAPTTGPMVEDEHKGKRARSMPRHDLTHSLLESQLTINCGRDGGGSSKREREESHCPVTSPNGTPSGTAPKRMCARTLRSNEILSSLSSTMTILSPTSNKSYTGKRKNITYDKYKKMRKLEESLKQQVKSESTSPCKVDKAVSAEEPMVKKSPPLPVITIKRDEISERVVSRAMVSALLKSTVSKLIMSGDPAVYPVPNGTQPRQPEVSAPDFGPPRTEPPPQKLTTPKPAPSSSGLLSLPSVTSTTTSGFSFGLTPKTPATTPSLPVSTPAPSTTSFSFGQQTSGVTSTTSQTATSSVQSPSSVAPAATVHTSFSLTKPQMSVSSAPSFGLGVSSASLVPPTTSSTLQLGGISTSSPTIPTFGLTSTSTTSDSSLSQATVIPAMKTPSFGLTTSAPSPLLKTATPTFGLASNTSTTTAPVAPSFSFGNPNPLAVKTATTAPPPSFSSIIANSTAPSSFSLTTSTVTTPSSNVFSSNTTAPIMAPVFGSTVTTPAIASATIPKPLFGSLTSSAAVTTASTVASTTTPSFIPSLLTSTAPAFGSTTSSTSNPIFGASLATKPLFGTTASTASPIFGAAVNSTTNSTNMFGSATQPTTAAPVFGATTTSVTTSTPLFGSTAVTTTTSSKPVFGSFTTVNPVTASNSIFGSINSTQSSTAPIFGGGNTTTPNPLFGSTATTTTTSTPFGTSTTTTPLFGGSSIAATTATPLFGASTSATSATPLFSATNVSTATTTPIFGSSSTSFSTTSAFGGPSTANASEGLFGMPPSNSGFKATSPFQVGGGDTTSTVPAFGGATSQVKPFEFGSAKPPTGGFTFKTGGTSTTPFAAQPAPNTSFSAQPPSQTPFSFTGSASTTTAAPSSGSPFVFGSANSGTTSSTATAGVKPFQFGPSAGTPVTPAFGATAAPTSTPAFGQSFTPTFGQPPSGQAPAFGQPATSPAPGAFQFSATQPPPPPGATGGLFSIGTGSTGTRLRDRRDRRRRV